MAVRYCCKEQALEGPGALVAGRGGPDWLVPRAAAFLYARYLTRNAEGQ